VLHPDGTMEIRILLDRAIVEAFWNEGELPYCFGALHTAAASVLELEGDLLIEELTVYPLRSIWENASAKHNPAVKLKTEINK